MKLLHSRDISLCLVISVIFLFLSTGCMSARQNGQNNSGNIELSSLEKINLDSINEKKRVLRNYLEKEERNENNKRELTYLITKLDLIITLYNNYIENKDDLAVRNIEKFLSAEFKFFSKLDPQQVITKFRNLSSPQAANKDPLKNLAYFENDLEFKGKGNSETQKNSDKFEQDADDSKVSQSEMIEAFKRGEFRKIIAQFGSQKIFPDKIKNSKELKEIYAISQYQVKNYESAIALFEELHRENQHIEFYNAKLKIYLALCNEKLGKEEKAKEYYNYLISLYSNEKEYIDMALLNKGALNKGDSDNCEKEIQKVKSILESGNLLIYGHKITQKWIKNEKDGSCGSKMKELKNQLEFSIKLELDEKIKKIRTLLSENSKFVEVRFEFEQFKKNFSENIQVANYIDQLNNLELEVSAKQKTAPMERSDNPKTSEYEKIGKLFQQAKTEAELLNCYSKLKQFNGTEFENEARLKLKAIENKIISMKREQASKFMLNAQNKSKNEEKIRFLKKALELLTEINQQFPENSYRLKTEENIKFVTNKIKEINPKYFNKK